MGETISEKIIAKAAGKKSVAPSEFVGVRPDLGPIMYAFAANDPPRRIKHTLKNLGIERILHPEKVMIFFDHNQPAKTVECAELYKSVREGVQDLGIKHFYAMKGIGHIVLAEYGLARPGMLIVHGDPHAATVGGIGAFVTNGGRYGSTPDEILATGEITIRVPETLECKVTGNLGKGVMSRDIWQHLIGEIGPDGAIGRVIEYDGPAIQKLSIDSRMTICNPVVFAGAETGIVNPDKETVDWVKERTTEPFDLLSSDSDAEYADTLEYDASKIEPLVAAPPDVYVTKTVVEVEGLEIDQAVLGTCAGGRMEDLRIAAKILKGRKINPSVRMLVVPATQDIYINGIREGLIETLARAGAVICAPTCDICWGRMGQLATGEISISQQTLNIPGRSGSDKAKIYLASAATIAASAVEGKITDPRNLL